MQNDPRFGGRQAVVPAEFEALRPRLIGAVRATCPRWLADHAEDIVQTVLVRLLEQRREERGEDPVSSSYLLRAAHNAAVDEIRRRFRRPEVAVDALHERDEPPARAPGPAEEAEAREIDRAIRACLGALAAPRRAAVMLFLLGYPLRDAGRLAGWGAKRTEHLTYRGLADMRSCLTAKGIEP